MSKLRMTGVCSLFLLLMSVGVVHAAETFDQQFVGSPLLVLTVLVVVAALFLLYHRMRK